MAVFDWLADIFGFTAPSVIEIIFVCCAVFGSLFLHCDDVANASR